MNYALNDILAYEHPGVVARFRRDNPQKADRAEILFKDLLRFFWASKRHQHDRRQAPEAAELDFIFIMDEEMRDIDQMWHVFLLYTEDYMNFCHKYFNEYLHHKPDIVPNMEKGVLDADTLFENNLEKFLQYNYDVLGEEVVTRWFAQSLAQ